MICHANHAAPRPGGPRAAPDRRRASPRGALTATPAFASAPRVLASEHRRRREFAALRASGLRAGEEGGGAGTAAPLPTRAPEGRGMQGDARAAAGRQGATAGSRYARARPRRRRREILREIFSPRLHLPSILLFRGFAEAVRRRRKSYISTYLRITQYHSVNFRVWACWWDQRHPRARRRGTAATGAGRHFHRP